MEALMQDVRYGFRMLLKNPAFAFVAVIALSLGIGANTAIFSVVHGVLLRPLPYRNADRLLVASLSVPDFRDLKEETKVFDAMAIWASNLYNLAGTGEAEQVRGAVVSPEFFSILGQAAIGRTFRPEEDREPLVVLGHGFWQRRFASDPAALGQSLELSGRSHTIVGVMPADFQFPSAQFELWVTFGSALGNTPQQSENRQLRIFRCLARLKPGVPFELARAEVDALSRRLQKEYPSTNDGVQIQFTPLYERIVGDVRPALLTSGDPSKLVASVRAALFSLDPNLRVTRFQSMEQLVSESAAQPRLNTTLLSSFALLALLLAAVGLYGVVSYTVTLRTHEIGIRMALGARAADVLSLVVAHGMVLALIGIGLGVAGALAVTRLISGVLFGISATDPVTFAVTALFLAGVALLASCIPARRATRVDPMVALRHE